MAPLTSVFFPRPCSSLAPVSSPCKTRGKKAKSTKRNGKSFILKVVSEQNSCFLFFFLWEKWRLLSKKNLKFTVTFVAFIFCLISLCYNVAISGPVAAGKKVESKGYNGRSPFPRRRRRERKRKRKGTAEDFLIGIWRRKRRKGKKMRNPPGEHEKKGGFLPQFLSRHLR